MPLAGRRQVSILNIGKERRFDRSRLGLLDWLRSFRFGLTTVSSCLRILLEMVRSDLLAFHRGRVVTRSMIWEHLYDEQDENTSNVVDVYIRYLRNKIDKGFEPPLILTRWGEGYMLRGDDG